MPTNVTGICKNTNFLMHNSHYRCIIDLGDKSHVYCNRKLYYSYTSLYLYDSYAMLPNSTKVKIERICNIKLNDDIYWCFITSL